MIAYLPWATRTFCARLALSFGRFSLFFRSPLLETQRHDFHEICIKGACQKLPRGYSRLQKKQTHSVSERRRCECPRLHGSSSATYWLPDSLFRSGTFKATTRAEQPCGAGSPEKELYLLFSLLSSCEALKSVSYQLQKKYHSHSRLVFWLSFQETIFR